MTCECSEKVRVGVVNLTEEPFDMPERGTDFAACFDVKANFWTSIVKGYTKDNEKMEWDVPSTKVVDVFPQERILVPTGITLIIPRGYCVKVYPRSGLSTKQGLTLVNNVGIIDSDYTGELFVSLVNLSDAEVSIAQGDKVAQIAVEKLVPTVFYEEETAELMSHAGESNRKFGDSGGFGSTGT